ncbi:uncharacterized protein TNCV_2957011 [Trichonephila clavipes]|nr:uncharacterized protein TNCV_2957011 [Trichonephila clavipes]
MRHCELINVDFLIAPADRWHFIWHKDEILTTARDLVLEVNKDDIEELIIGHEDQLTIELQEILNEEHQETQRNVSPSEQEEDERGPMPTSAIQDLLKKWEDVRAKWS